MTMMGCEKDWVASDESGNSTNSESETDSESQSNNETNSDESGNGTDSESESQESGESEESGSEESESEGSDEDSNPASFDQDVFDNWWNETNAIIGDAMKLERQAKVGKGAGKMAKAVADGMMEMRRTIMQTMNETAPMIR